MNNKYSTRLINKGDVQAELDIYKPYVLNTILSFEYEVQLLTNIYIGYKLTLLTMHGWFAYTVIK